MCWSKNLFRIIPVSTNALTKRLRSQILIPQYKSLVLNLYALLILPVLFNGIISFSVFVWLLGFTSKLQHFTSC